MMAAGSGFGAAPPGAGGDGAPGPTAAFRAAFEEFVRWSIVTERPGAPGFLPAGECDEFMRYYRGLPAPGDVAAIRRYTRGLWRSEAGWVARWLGDRAARTGRAPRVMDAGSGFGTYSMLFAAAGAEVTGVDLRPDRLSAAARRLEFHHERTGSRLRVEYARADLTTEWPARYDLVWVYNALSHIDPLANFLAEARRHLDPGGVLVVGDLNGANPRHRRRLEQVRTEVHQEYVAPDGQRHAYAVERTFAPAELRALVEEAGMRVVHHQLYWPGLSRLPDPVYHGLLEPLQRRWTLGRRFARRQLLAATPAGRPPV
jgi:2-polyprenyl-3-methyl-5-hydroxy-6-metoxy-1,4-benzoquinol methylase